MDWLFLSDSSASINDLGKKFHDDTINFIDNQNVPKKKVTEKYLKLRSKPFINTKIQKLIVHRDKLHSPHEIISTAGKTWQNSRRKQNQS